MTSNFFYNAAVGDIPGISTVNAFGRLNDVTGTYKALATSGTYQMPSTAKTLEVLSNHNSDKPGDNGAQKVIVEGLDQNCELFTEEVVLNGTTPVDLTTNVMRVFELRVSETGTYSDISNGCHLGKITLKEKGGADVWAEILDPTPYARGRSMIGCFTTPAGYECNIQNIYANTHSAKTVSYAFFKRENIDVVSSPYPALELVLEFDEQIGQSFFEADPVYRTIPEKTDFGFIVRSDSGIFPTECSVMFDILLRGI